MIDPRWRTTLTVTRYLVLGILVVSTTIDQWTDWQRLAPTLVLCAVAGGLMFVMGATVSVFGTGRRYLPARWHNRPVAVGLLMASLITVNLVLVLRDSWFGFLTIAVFPFAYAMLAWPWELLAVAATAAVAGLAQSSNIGRGPSAVVATIAVVVVNILAMCGLAWGLRIAEQQQERVATEAERSRLAREIHDTLAQGFAGIVTQLQASEEAPDDRTRRRHLDAALALARDGLTEARRSVQALRPAELNAVRLREALAHVAQSRSARTGIPVDLSTPKSGRVLSIDAEVALLRTAQEALANVERHAEAHRVELSLRSDTGGTVLEVRDDGRGFDPTAPATLTDRPSGYGLIGMQERIESVAGRLVVESRPGKGALVRAEVPAWPGCGCWSSTTTPSYATASSGWLPRDSDVEVVGEASDGAEALALARVLEPDVVLMDLRMPVMGGVAATGKLTAAGTCRVVVLTTFEGDANVLPAIEAGAIGYLLKDAPREELLRAIHAAAAGNAVLAPSVAARLVGRVRAPDGGTLSPRELEVLALVADGATNRAAARQLHVSEATVKTHLLSIYTKLAVSDRAAAVAEGFRRGLLDR